MLIIVYIEYIVIVHIEVKTRSHLKALLSMESVLQSTENNGDKIVKFEVHKNIEQRSNVQQLLIKCRDC